MLGGFESTSHFKDTSIPSLKGYPKPGVREIANDGVSAKTYSHVNFPNDIVWVHGKYTWIGNVCEGLKRRQKTEIKVKIEVREISN